jgi:hypothetical protein
MGFFSAQSILGGSSGSSSSNTGGFNALPAEIKGAYTNYGQQIQDLLKSGNLTKMYTPLAETAGETKAYGAIDKGFTPNAAQLSSDIAMQTNPYDQYVIDEINRQSGGDYSILKQALSEAGQMGSNRQNLGANDIDLSRLNQIGGFKRDAYNTALQNALTILPGQRAGDATAQLGAGANQRSLYGQTQQAPVAALQQIATALGILPTAEGSTTSSSKSSSSPGIASLFASDINLKENIIPVGMENGHNVYEFSYKGKPERYVGVMAQEVEKTHPHAVIHTIDGLKVNYDMIGVKMRRVA